MSLLLCRGAMSNESFLSCVTVQRQRRHALWRAPDMPSFVHIHQRSDPTDSFTPGLFDIFEPIFPNLSENRQVFWAGATKSVWFRSTVKNIMVRFLRRFPFCCCRCRHQRTCRVSTPQAAGARHRSLPCWGGGGVLGYRWKRNR